MCVAKLTYLWKAIQLMVPCPLRRSARTYMEQLAGVVSNGAHALLTSNNLFFSVNFRAGQSLTVTLCSRLSTNICILQQQLR